MARSAQHGTLTANAVTTVTVNDGYPGVTVLNRSQTGTIWVTLNGSAPTVAGTGCYPVLGLRYFHIPPPHTTAATIKMIAATALDWTVEGDPGASA